jgi:NodT family efflux transporter outer membrane factor (OMF) lipoprotein
VTLPASFTDSGELPLQVKWWLVFDDSDLNQLINTALTRNFSLLATKERIIQAQALATQAGAALIPSLDGEGTGSFTRNYQTDKTTNYFALDLAASYEVDLWGRLRNTKDAALLELEATTSDFHTAQISLSAEVALVWLQITEAHQQIELLTEQKETNEKVLDVITTQFRSGKTDISDVLQQRQLIESNNGSLATLRANKRVLDHQLSILLGTPPQAATSAYANTQQVLPDLPPLPESGLPLDLLQRRPDVQSSFLTLQATDQKAAAAIANRFPRLSLSAELTTYGSSAKDLFSDWFSTLAANLFAPIIDGGYLKAEVTRTESVARQQLNTYSQVILNAMTEVEDALVREKEQLLSLESEKIQLQLAAETVEHVGHRYRQGGEDYQRVLLALISQQNLQRSIVSTKLSLLSNRIALYRALSGPLE